VIIASGIHPNQIINESYCEECVMAEQKMRELMARHDITIDDLRARKHTLHHLRNVVRGEHLPFDVFRGLVNHRR
jgi:hypothetical protein